MTDVIKGIVLAVVGVFILALLWPIVSPEFATGGSLESYATLGGKIPTVAIATILVAMIFGIVKLMS